jgi:hypothetical protein
VSDPAGAAAQCAVFRSLERKRPTGSSKTRSPGARPRISKPVPWAPRWWCHLVSSARLPLAARLRSRRWWMATKGSMCDPITDRAHHTSAALPAFGARIATFGRRRGSGRRASSPALATSEEEAWDVPKSISGRTCSWSLRSVTVS